MLGLNDEAFGFSVTFLGISCDLGSFETQEAVFLALTADHTDDAFDEPDAVELDSRSNRFFSKIDFL